MELGLKSRMLDDFKGCQEDVRVSIRSKERSITGG